MEKLRSAVGVRRGLLLLSGGVDSAAVAAWKRPSHALVVDYGQLPGAGEIRAARAIADDLGIPIVVEQIDCKNIGAGLLVGRAPARKSPSPEWWPYRNQLLITIGAAVAHRLGCTTLLLGTVR